MDIRGELASNLFEQNPAYREYARGDGAITVRLKKALYGLRQSAYLWYEEIKSTLVNECNLKVSAVDRSVFFNEHTWVTLHVDDLMIVSDRDGDMT
jgi:hypothetical protein